MSLVKRAFHRRSVLSVLLTAAVITLMVFAGPRAAQAVTVMVHNPTSGTVGSTYEEGINQWVLAGGVFGGAVLIIGLAVYLFWYRKILD